MLTLKTRSSKDAMTILKADHTAVKELFDLFEDEESADGRKNIAEKACKELQIHATIEEEMFYPALRQVMEDEDGMLDEADEEHHEVKILVAELEQMRGDETNFCAKFVVLSENVRHHIKEEEGELFPMAKKTDIDFDALGERMRARKQELMTSGVPRDPETEMIENFGVAKESPSRKAVKTFSPPMSGKKKRSGGRKH